MGDADQPLWFNSGRHETERKKFSFVSIVLFARQTTKWREVYKRRLDNHKTSCDSVFSTKFKQWFWVFFCLTSPRDVWDCMQFFSRIDSIQLSMFHRQFNFIQCSIAWINSILILWCRVSSNKFSIQYWTINIISIQFSIFRVQVNSQLNIGPIITHWILKACKNHKSILGNFIYQFFKWDLSKFINM